MLLQNDNNILPLTVKTLNLVQWVHIKIYKVHKSTRALNEGSVNFIKLRLLTFS